MNADDDLLQVKTALPAIDKFKEKALQWASSFDTACLLDSNGFTDPYTSFDLAIAAGTRRLITPQGENAFGELGALLEKEPGWYFGFLSYDLKNDVEELTSANADHLRFPDLCFFQPLHLLLVKGGELTIMSANPDEVLAAIGRMQEMTTTTRQENLLINARFSREDYIATVQAIREHLRRGDVYELNFCQEFYAENASIDPVSLYLALNAISPTPFSGFMKHNERYILSASPERFIKKAKDRLISQPIKGTASRSADPDTDREIIGQLRSDAKEQAENVMIVDLVRNDLTRCSVPGSVKVEELFGIYSFSQVHQMISTIVSNPDPAKGPASLISAVFPMGSMTGAPKFRAMQLIEQYERTKRGAFSGAIGYFTPEGDFDFNVVIRTLLYNAAEKYLSFQAGSAITYDSDPEKEYGECLLKVSGIMSILGKSWD
ncbi:anthranilate synthase component I family protein [Hufsiella ginkgonis]|uniref:Aminodeoxychorismate synthase component I n=1 Tax=Hufsiella ginkgonis TaxID=2695274 RepID=A0A7K1XXU9_9SPHI|nr:anthranilate synthase component I family protein [Hufsiella ginkgonis]MXV15835.1 aminodeoxychorismate synthase component I [Hufsiella ginkgonis]